MEDLDKAIIEIWEQEFSPKTNSHPMPVTLFEDLKQLIVEARIDELEKFKEHSYNLGFRGSGMEHLEDRIKSLKEREK